MKGEPHTIVDFEPPSGNRKRVFYGDDGYIVKELHTTGHDDKKAHPYGNKGEHMHDWVFVEGYKRSVRFIRDLTELEYAQNSDFLDKTGGDEDEENEV